MIKTVESRENSPVSLLWRVIPEELQPRPEGEVVWITQDRDSWVFHPIWIGEGLPADAKRALNFLSHREIALGEQIPVLIAKRVSPGAKEIIESQGLSWADASGRARLVVPGRVYVSRLEPIRADAKRAFTWSGAEQTIAEVILAQHIASRRTGPGPIARVTELAQSSGVSLAHSARVLRHFDEVGYTAKTGAERGSSASRVLRDPARMLSEWAVNHTHTSQQRRPTELHVPWRDTEDSLFVVVDALSGWDWAVTGEVAADRIAPHLTSIATLDLYVPAGQLFAATGALLRQQDVTQVESGGRIRVFEADSYVFRLTDEVRGVRTVSPVRVYADLLRGRGRAAEAAEHLREVAIGF